MEHEIIFRGRTKEGTWVYGDLIHMDGKVYIGEQNSSAGKEVAPNSVGQFTGYTDANGEKIFEGDLLETEDFIAQAKWSEAYGQFEGLILLKNASFNLHLFLEGHPETLVIKKEDKQ